MSNIPNINDSLIPDSKGKFPDLGYSPRIPESFRVDSHTKLNPEDGVKIALGILNECRPNDLAIKHLIQFSAGNNGFSMTGFWNSLCYHAQTYGEPYSNILISVLAIGRFYYQEFKSTKSLVKNETVKPDNLDQFLPNVILTTYVIDKDTNKRMGSHNVGVKFCRDVGSVIFKNPSSKSLKTGLLSFTNNVVSSFNSEKAAREEEARRKEAESTPEPEQPKKPDEQPVRTDWKESKMNKRINILEKRRIIDKILRENEDGSSAGVTQPLGPKDPSSPAAKPPEKTGNAPGLALIANLDDQDKSWAVPLVNQTYALGIGLLTVLSRQNGTFFRFAPKDNFTPTTSNDKDVRVNPWNCADLHVQNDGTTARLRRFMPQVDMPSVQNVDAFMQKLNEVFPKQVSERKILMRILETETDNAGGNEQAKKRFTSPDDIQASTVISWFSSGQKQTISSLINKIAETYRFTKLSKDQSVSENRRFDTVYLVLKIDGTPGKSLALLIRKKSLKVTYRLLPARKDVPPPATDNAIGTARAIKSLLDGGGNTSEKPSSDPISSGSDD